MDDFVACARCDRTEPRKDVARIADWVLNMADYRIFCPECAVAVGLVKPPERLAA